MSLCFSYFQGGKALICADSRVSVTVNERKFFVSDKFRKIYQIGDKVIFFSGLLELGLEICNQITKESTIEDIRKIALTVFSKIHGNKKIAVDDGITMQVFMTEKGKQVLYSLNHTDLFTLSRKEPKEHDLLALGAKSQEALDYCFKLRQENESKDIKEIFLETYSQLSDETIGGYIRFYIISDGLIESGIAHLNDNKPLAIWKGERFRHECEDFNRV